MYSIVLMMAMSGSADMPAAHGCNGGCNGGCAGSACNGCGGGGHGCRGGLFGGHGCKGCNGGGHGCRGGCNGCHGFLGGLFKGHGCKGCNGCNGGCNGCKGGCNGGCHGAAAGCTGCTGGAPATPAKKDMPEEKKKDGVSAPATIVVNIPADAKLSIDDNMTRSTETVRRFVTPELENGKDFYYTLKAEMVVDGQTQTSTKRILVRAGEEAQVTMEFAVSSVASK